MPSRKDAEQAEAQETAKLAHARIRLAPSPARGGADGKPHLIARGGSIDALQDELKREAQLELADHHDGRVVPPDCHEVAALDLALDLEAQPLEEALHG